MSADLLSVFRAFVGSFHSPEYVLQSTTVSTLPTSNALTAVIWGLGQNQVDVRPDQLALLFKVRLSSPLQPSSARHSNLLYKHTGHVRRSNPLDLQQHLRARLHPLPVHLHLPRLRLPQNMLRGSSDESSLFPRRISPNHPDMSAARIQLEPLNPGVLWRSTDQRLCDWDL